MDVIGKVRDVIRRYQRIGLVPQQLADMRSEVSAVRQQVSAIRQQVSAIRQQVAEVLQQGSGMREALLPLRYHAGGRPKGSPSSEARLKEVVPISEQFDRLQQMAPQAYAVWRPLLDVNEGAYEGLPLDSCSVAGHPMATLFRFFLAPYLKGRVLDIGCGPQRVPIYLEDYPIEGLYGIDPLSEPIHHPFHFFEGLAEFLPWADSQFNLVVAATSLDHVLLLDEVFSEVRRVLSPDGMFVVWVSFIPGSEAYDPYQKKIKKVDEYHLFHFGREWFLTAIDPFFTIFEEFTFDSPKTSTFLALRPRKQGVNSDDSTSSNHRSK
jgi:SAM-dependent methyltransferase